MRTPGVEPGSQAWEACMMPLHQASYRLSSGGPFVCLAAGFRESILKKRRAIFEGCFQRSIKAPQERSSEFHLTWTCLEACGKMPI